MNSITQVMFERGVFVEKCPGIIEIYPRKTMLSELFNAALIEINKTHEIVKMTPYWLRAFKRK